MMYVVSDILRRLGMVILILGEHYVRDPRCAGVIGKILVALAAMPVFHMTDIGTGARQFRVIGTCREIVSLRGNRDGRGKLLVQSSSENIFRHLLLSASLPHIQ